MFLNMSQLCPELVIVPCNMEKYAAVAEKIRDVFRQYDSNFSPMSLDEAYLDITDLVGRKVWREKDGLEESSEKGHEVELGQTAAQLVTKMREEIKRVTGGLTGSAGIAPNCLLAKVCSDLNKPDGQYELPPHTDTIMKFMSDLSIRKV